MTDRITNLRYSDAAFLHELVPAIETLVDRHTSTAKTYYPYDVLDAMATEDSQHLPALPQPVIDALPVNLLTEEGLPYYTTTIDRTAPDQHPFKDWLHQWTAEEGRHAPIIANWMYATGSFDMRQIETDRMVMMVHPDTPQPQSFVEGIVYPSFQEPATEVSHRNVMRQLPTEHTAGRRALAHVIADEVRHGNFYRDLTSAALEFDPDTTIMAIDAQVRGFAMPGKSIPGFRDRANRIEEAGIFGGSQLLAIYDDVLTNQWGVWDLTLGSSEGEEARNSLNNYVEKLRRVVARRQERLESSQNDAL